MEEPWFGFSCGNRVLWAVSEKTSSRTTHGPPENQKHPEAADRLREAVQDPPLLAFRRPKNLRGMIACAEVKQAAPPPAQATTRVRCKTYTMMKKEESFTSHSTGHTYRTRYAFTCKIKNLVYLQEMWPPVCQWDGESASHQDERSQLWHQHEEYREACSSPLHSAEPQPERPAGHENSDVTVETSREFLDFYAGNNDTDGSEHRQITLDRWPREDAMKTLPVHYNKINYDIIKYINNVNRVVFQFSVVQYCRAWRRSRSSRNVAVVSCCIVQWTFVMIV